MAVEEKVNETRTAERAVAGPTAAEVEELRQAIALRAYYRYCERGCAPGCDVEDWLAAEREVLAGHHASPPASPARESAGDHGTRPRHRTRR